MSPQHIVKKASLELVEMSVAEPLSSVKLVYVKKLLFIDTNIWLDFYRVRNDAAIKLLDHVEAMKECVIVTYQVECEFKKNRQNVIVESYNSLKIESNIGRPAVLADAQASTAITRGLDNAKKGVAKLRKRMEKLLVDPTHHDPVYKACQRIFHRTDELVLTRDNPQRRGIRHRARTRYLHGLPPRKRNDTSMGDAFNWEWIVNCAITQNAEIVIVSRDSDYGVTFNKTSYVNDHLRHEFSDRVSKKRALFLYDSLSNALRDHFSIKISKEEESAEEELAKEEGTKVRSLSAGDLIRLILERSAKGPLSNTPTPGRDLEIESAEEDYDGTESGQMDEDETSDE